MQEFCFDWMLWIQENNSHPTTSYQAHQQVVEEHHHHHHHHHQEENICVYEIKRISFPRRGLYILNF